MADQNQTELLIKAKNLTEGAFKAVSAALEQIEKDTESVNKKTQSLGDGIKGFFDKHKESVGALTTVMGGVAAGIGAIAAGIVTLGQRGSEVDSIRGQFAQLTGEIGESADALIGGLRKAVDGTISDFELMKATNAGLSQGLKLNREEFALTGEAARIYADRLGGDTLTAYTTLIQAMATGRDATLKSIGVNIDAAAAVDKFARSLGKEKSELTENEQIFAKRTAIIKTMRDELERTGSVEESFGDRIARIQTNVQNFTDSLGVAIATSPVVNEAMSSIADAIGSAFGDNQIQQVQALTGYVNTFAIFAVDVGMTVVSTAKYIGFAWQGLKVIFASVMTALFFVAEQLTELIAAAVTQAERLPVVGEKLKGVGAGARESALQIEAMRKSFQTQVGEHIDGAGSIQNATDGVNKTLGEMRARMVAAGQAQASTDTIAQAFNQTLRGQSETVGAADKVFDAYNKKVRELNTALQLAERNGAPLTVVLEQHGSAIREVVRQSQLLGQTLPDAIQRAAAALQQADIAKVMTKAGDDIRRLNEENLKAAAEQQKEYTNQLNEDTIAASTLKIEWARKVRDAQNEIGATQLAKEQQAIDQWWESEREKLDAINASADAYAQLDDARDALIQGIIDANAATNDWLGTLEGIAGLFDRLSSKAGKGGAFATVTGAAGSAIGSLASALQANKQGGGNWGIAGNFTKGSTTDKVMAGAGAAVGVAEGAMEVWSATDKAGAGERALGGALAGAKAGAMFGPYGMAIGAAAGLVVGLVRGKPEWAKAADEVGRDFGVKISNSLAKAIEKDAKELFKKDRSSANQFNLSKIIDEGGGVNTSNLDKWTAKLRDTFSFLERKQFDVGQAAKVIDEVWPKLADTVSKNGGLITKELKEIIELDKRFGTNSAAVAEYVGQQLGVSLQGITTFASNATIKSQEAATGIGASLAGIFAQMSASGTPLTEILAQMEPAVSNVGAQLAKAGLDGGAAFAQLHGWIALSKDEIAGPGIQAVLGLGEAMKGLHNSGIMNQEMFGGLARQVADTFNDLKAQGKGGNDTLKLMQPTLQTLWQLKKDFGYAVDDTTQALLDEAEAAGLVGEKHQTSEQKMVDGIGKVVTKLDELMVGLGIKLPQAMEKGVDGAIAEAGQLTGSLNDVLGKIPERVVIPIDFQVGAVPDLPSAPQGSQGDGGEVQGAAGGGLYSRPTFRVIAERRPEIVGEPGMIVNSLSQAMRQSGIAGGGGDAETVAAAVADAIGKMKVAQTDITVQATVIDGTGLEELVRDRILPIATEIVQDNGGDQARTKLQGALGLAS